MRRGRKKFPKRRDFIRINDAIRADEVRLMDSEDQMIGVMPLREAQKRAEAEDVDLIEVNAKAKPVIAKLMDYGKFQYEKKKAERDIRQKAKSTETKTLQVKIGTDEHDLNLKARRASEWLKEGHRIKLDLYLRGRAKYLDRNFLRSRLDRLLALITEDYKVAAEPKKSPKGLTVILEVAPKPKNKQKSEK